MSEKIQNFADALKGKFAKHPVLKNVEEDKVAALIDNFDSWTGIHAYGAEGLVADYGFIEADANALIRVAAAEAAEEAAAPTEVTVEAAAVAEAVTPLQPVNNVDNDEECRDHQVAAFLMKVELFTRGG